MLEYVDLSQNSFSQTIPENLGGLNNLDWINFSNNSLSGTLPDLYDFENIQMLNVGENQLTGNIPDWIYSKNSLSNLQLRENIWTCPIADYCQSDQLADTCDFTEDMPCITGNIINFRCATKSWGTKPAV